MKKEVNPVVMVVVIVAVVALAGFFFMKSSQPQVYPGLGAPQPTAPKGGGSDKPMGKMTREEAMQRGIPGAVRPGGAGR